MAFSDGTIAEPATPETVQVNTEPAAQLPAPANGHSQEPVPATTA